MISSCNGIERHVIGNEWLGIIVGSQGERVVDNYTAYIWVGSEGNMLSSEPTKRVKEAVSVTYMSVTQLHVSYHTRCESAIVDFRTCIYCHLLHSHAPLRSLLFRFARSCIFILLFLNFRTSDSHLDKELFVGRTSVLF